MKKVSVEPLSKEMIKKLKAEHHKPNFVPAPTPPSPEPTVIPIPVYDAGGRVKKYEEGGEVEEWEPILEDDTDERTLEMKDEALEGDKKSILDIIKDRINIGIEPKKGKSKKSKPSKKKNKPKTKK